VTDTTPLPTWNQMGDLDKGAALLHVWKRSREGALYAVAEHPCRYLEDPALVALDRTAASRHAASVGGKWDAVNGRLNVDETTRLYDLALDGDDRRRDVNRGAA
jgi:hypothetical protein